MKLFSLLPLIFIVLCAGCATRRAAPPASASLAAVVRKSSETQASVESARSDGKEVRRLHIESMGLLERLDYKTTLLLKK